MPLGIEHRTKFQQEHQNALMQQFQLIGIQTSEASIHI